jgi:hypothetical protein
MFSPWLESSESAVAHTEPCTTPADERAVYRTEYMPQYCLHRGMHASDDVNKSCK